MGSSELPIGQKAVRIDLEKRTGCDIVIKREWGLGSLQAVISYQSWVIVYHF